MIYNEACLFAQELSSGAVWTHLDANVAEHEAWLLARDFDPLVSEALLADETRPRIVEHLDGVLMILRGVNLNENSEPEDMVSVRLWVSSDKIISVQRRPLKAVNDLQQRIATGKGPQNTGDFLAQLIARLFEKMEPVFLELNDTLDDVEEQVMLAPDASSRQSITQIRKQAIAFRRYVAPQRDVIAHLRTSELTWLSLGQRRQLQESLDRVIRYTEDLDALRERGQVIKDELSNALADKMNKNLYMLSVIAAIFLPLGFLTGLLGVNVGGMPGVDNPAGFYISCGILVVVMIIQIWVFKWLKWF